MASIDFITVKEFRETKKHVLTQKCHISTRVAKQSNLSFLDFVRISTRDKSVICQVYLGDNENSVSYDSCITEEPDRVQNLHAKDPSVSIQQLSCQDGEVVTIKVVLTDSFYQRTVSSQKQSTNHLQKRISKCLKNCVVTAGSSVDLTHSRLAKLYGVVQCFVKSVSPKSEGVRSQAIRITDTTNVFVEGIQSLECYNALKVSHERRDMDNIAGYEEQYKVLTDELKFSTEYGCSRKVLLHGPSGCGKTHLVRKMAKISRVAFLMVGSAEVISSNPGESESNLAALFHKAKRLCKEVPCVLFLDDVDCICVKREAAKTSSVYNLTTALLAQLDNVSEIGGLLVVMATNSLTSLDQALRRSDRISRELLISVPTKKQRQEILETHLKHLSLSDDVDLGRLTLTTTGYVGADLELLCKSAWQKALQQKMSSPLSAEEGLPEVCQADFESALLSVKPTLQRGVEAVVELPSVSWQDIGGLDNVKIQIKQAVEWPLLYPESYEALGLPLAKGVLLFGPPGCGKTTLAQAAASACHVTFLSLSCAQLYSPFVGDSEKKLSEIFQQARALAPSILFLDEIDSIVGKRSESSSSSSVSERVLSVLLNEMDGVGVRHSDQVHGNQMQLEAEDLNTENTQELERHETAGGWKSSCEKHVLLIAATNRPDMLDPALLRPGRMDRKIYVPPPDYPGRLQALEIHTRKMPLSEDVNLSLLAEQTEGFTGADISGLCKEAGLLALKESISAEEITKEHFEKVLNEFKLSNTLSLLQIKEMYKKFS